MAVRYCPHCSHEVPASARFCSKCAATLTPSPSIMPGEAPAFAPAPTGVDRIARNAPRMVIAFALFVLAVMVAILAYKLNHPIKPAILPSAPQIDPPTNLVSTDTTPTTTSLSWTASTTASVTKYSVYNGSVLVTTVKETTANVTNLTPNQTYVFTVVAKDAEGNTSPPSDPVNVPTPGPGQPDPPANVAVTASTPDSVTISWTPSADTNVTGYEVDGGSSTPTSVDGVSTSSVTITKLTPNTPYTFTVKAKNAAGELSVPSSPASVTTAQSDVTTTGAPINPIPPNVPGMTGSDGTTGSTGNPESGGQPANP